MSLFEYVGACRLCGHPDLTKVRSNQVRVGGVTVQNHLRTRSRRRACARRRSRAGGAPQQRRAQQVPATLDDTVSNTPPGRLGPPGRPPASPALPARRRPRPELHERHRKRRDARRRGCRRRAGGRAGGKPWSQSRVCWRRPHGRRRQRRLRGGGAAERPHAGRAQDERGRLRIAHSEEVRIMAQGYRAAARPPPCTDLGQHCSTFLNLGPRLWTTLPMQIWALSVTP